MRCKKHNTDPSSINGVCASCLRERLIKVILAQKQAEADSQARNHCNSNTNPQLPRSVSPHNNPMNSVTDVQRPNKPHLNHSLSDHRFYNSPQIAVSSGGCIGATSSNKKKKNIIRFSSFSNLFRSNARDGDSESNHGVSVSTSGEPSGAAGKPTSVTSSPLWLPNVRQKNKAIHANKSSSISGDKAVRKQRCVRDRGMSPVRTSDDGGGEDFSDGSSGYESAEAESFKQTPKRTPAHQTAGRRGGGQRSTSELIFCLSPLVRASPNRLWNLKGKPPVDSRFSGDVRPHIANVKSFCANRSRKLADFGRSHPNR